MRKHLRPLHLLLAVLVLMGIGVSGFARGANRHRRPEMVPFSGINFFFELNSTDEDSRFVYDIRLPADATSVTVPAEFFESDTEYELEVLAVEKSGNQTITVLFFRTE